MKKLLLSCFLFSVAALGFAQAPNISYPSPQVYLVGKTITNLVPANTGGAVPNKAFSLVSTLAGNGTTGLVNANGSSASFNHPYSIASDATGNIYVADYDNNVIRKITPSGDVSTFISSGLSTPSGVAVGPDGNIYIADTGNQLIKMATPAGVVTVIAGNGATGAANGPALSASFSNPQDVAVDASGTVYVADNLNNQIRKISGGVVSILAGSGTPGSANGTFTAAQFKNPFGVGVDAAGNVYVADYGNSTIRKVTPGGVVTTVAGSGTAGYVDANGTSARFNKPGDVVVDAIGNIYVSDSFNSIVRKINPAKDVITFAGASGYFDRVDGQGVNANFGFPLGLTIDPSGNLYTADVGTNYIRKVTTAGYIIDKPLPDGLVFDATTGIISGTPTTVTAAANYTVYAFNNAGGSSKAINIAVRLASTDATLSNLVASAGALSPTFAPGTKNFVVNVANGVSSTTVTPTLNNSQATLTVNGVVQASGATSATVPLNIGNNDITIKVTAEDGISTANYLVSVVRAKVSVPGPNITYTTANVFTVNTAITALAPTNTGGAVPAISYGEVTTIATGFNTPWGITTDVAGNVYVGDASRQIRKITPAGVVSVFVPAVAGLSTSVTGLSSDPQGNIYAADAGNNKIRKISPAGTVTTLAGYAGNYGYVNGDDAVAEFSNPSGVAVDGNFNVYIADQDTRTIRKRTLDGQVALLAGTGQTGQQNGPGITATFTTPLGIASDFNGNVYIGDTYGYTVRKITPAGVVSTFAGNGSAGETDGVGTAAAFDRPAGVAVDQIGTVYVADAANSKIRTITPAGNVQIFAGNGTYALVDGNGMASSFSYPLGIATDQYGHLFVADLGNAAVRKIETLGYGIYPHDFLPAGLVFDYKTGIISGTPTAVTPKRTYYITAYNLGGSSTFTTTIQITAITNEARLSNATLDFGTLSPAFASATTTYSASVSKASIIITPTAMDGAANIKINGVAVLSGVASAPVPLAIGANAITILVTATNGVTTKTYTLNVTRIAPPANNDLSGLALSSGTLAPAFTAATTNYTASVSNATTSFTVTPAASNGLATIQVNGVTVASGAASAALPLTVGANTITTIVSDENGNNKTYTLIVTRAASANAGLTSLGVSEGTLAPVFNTATLNYASTVASTTAGITVTPAVTDATATVKVNGVTVVSGMPSATIPLVSGSNIITTVVTAQDGTTTQTYTLNVTKPLSSDADLSALALSSGVLSPVFTPGVLVYSSSVSGTVSSIQISPTSADASSVIKVNGVTVASGLPSAAVPLATGPNAITVAVTAGDGVTVKTYTLNITRALSSNSTLSNLALSTGVLSPAFAPATFIYTSTVSSAVTGIALTATVADATASVKINGVTAASGFPSGVIPLNFGANIITTVITAEDGSTTNYTTTVTRSSSADASLSALSLSTGTLSPAFATGTTGYTATVPNATTGITLTPGSTDPNAVIKVNGVTVTSGAASTTLPLTVGANVITVQLTAQDGVTTSTYSITVTRAASAIATLSALTTSAGPLSPAFNSAINNYAILVTNAITTATITPTVTDAAATIKVNGVTVASAGTSVPVSLNVGANTITTVVTAEDGVTTQSYSVNITRGASSNADLSNLAISAGTLAPAFSAATLSYTNAVANTITGTTITPTVADATATVQVNGVAVVSGSPSANIPLTVGTNVITTVVTAQDGTPKTYTTTVTRAPSSDASLSALTISAGVLSPAFAPGTTTYTATVPNATAGITLTPTGTNGNSAIQVNGVTVTTGTASGVLPLVVGANNIVVQTIAEDGVTISTYNLTVTRAASAVSTLSSLATTAGPLSPAFTSGTLTYAVSVATGVTSTTVTPTVSDANSTVKVNGITVASGTASGAIALNIGSNAIVTQVTAEDGVTTSSYMVNVTRAASANASLSSLTTSAGILSPAFASGTLLYTASVSNATASVSLMPTAFDATATITVNGITVASGAATSPVLLTVGLNTITTVVTAQDGISTQTYTVNITRAGSADGNLSALTISAGTLSPAFAAAITNYTVTVANANSTVTVTPTQNETNATITVNGTVVTGGTASAAIPLVVGNNTITIVVTAQDGTPKSYVITANRQASANALLAGLTPSAGALTPDFASATNAYQVTVINTVTAINFTPALSDANATVTVNGSAVSSGTASSNIALLVGVNNVPVVVTAQNGTVNTYTVAVTRGPSIDARLSNLVVSGATLSPSFASATAVYTSAVANTVTSVTLAPTVNEPNATVVVNGVPVVSGTASGAIPLIIGNNVITTTVTAQDGGSIKIYQVTVVRAQSSDASLSALTISSGTLSPTFTSAVTSYTALVSNATASITLTPTNTEANAVIRVNGNLVSGGATSAAIPLAVGSNAITVQVTAQDGTIGTYTVTVVKAAPVASTDANLASLAVSTGTLAPAFAQATMAYNVSVPNATTSIIVTAASTDANATITVNGTTVASGTASAPINLVAGANVITTIITAQDGTTSKTYTITVTRAPSTNADLANIALSAGSLSPGFSQATIGYTATVGNTATTIQLTPTVADATATIKVNGVTVASGTASGALPLVVGANTITTVVTAQSGATKTYTVTVTRARSPNADLASLTLSAGALSPAFAAATTTYTAAVGNAVSTIRLTPTVADVNATIKVNGVTVASGVASAALPLVVGANTITTVVTAQDGTPKTYTLTVTRAPSSNADLANMTLSTGTLSPVFAAGTINYTATVGNAVSTIKLTPTIADATATIQVNGITVASGTASTNIALLVGANAITTVVTAQDGTTKTYVLVVDRARSPNANLAGLSISTGTLSPVFGAATINYTATVANSVTGITVTATVAEPNATLQVNGAAVASGSPSANWPLVVGPNAVTTLVTAQDGTTKTYTITVTRAASPDATLSNLALSAGTLTPGFVSGTTSYTVSVTNAVASITVTPTVNEPNATVKVNGVTVASGSASAALPLLVGANTITTVVTAQDGTSTKTYTTTVTRLRSADATLSNLTLSAGTLSPVFASATTAYAASVGNAVTSITLTPTVNELNATVKVNGVAVASGAASAGIPLVVGVNTITADVTAQDGTLKTYTVTVSRAPSSNADLANITLSTGTLSPVFTAATVTYTASVSNATSTIKLTPTVADATATLQVNNVTVPSGSPTADIALVVGPNVITTIVTAEDGTTKTYTVTVDRARSPNADLANLSISNGTLSPVFAAGVINYTAAVPNTVTGVTVTAIVSEPNASLKVNGTSVVSGNPSANLPLVVGANTITTLVTAQDGTLKTNTITITRAPSPDATLSNLALNAGTLTPGFVATTTVYTAAVANAVTTITVTPTVNEPNATVKVNGVTVASGAASAAIPLLVGTNVITTLVTAQDGTSTQTYTTTVTRAPSSNAFLTALGVSTGNYSPGFGRTIYDYTMLVTNNVTTMSFTPVLEDNTATITVNGLPATNGVASAPVTLAVGNNFIRTVVTAQDGVTTKTYTVIVNRALSSENDLSALSISTGPLTPGFQSGITAYTASVSNTTTSLKVTPTVADVTATVKVNGVATVSGTASGPVALTVGLNTINVVVTAQNTQTNTYTITVTRIASANADLAGLTSNTGSLSPAFAANTTNYTAAAVNNTINTIKLTPTTADATATITVNGISVTSGSASPDIPLIVGVNSIPVVVKAQAGNTKTYTVSITRLPSSNADLAGITITGGTLNPAFTAGNTSYTTTIGNANATVTVTPSTSDATSKVTVNGSPVTPGTASGSLPLVVGVNTITIVVTAQDGTPKTYTVIATREASSNADLTDLAPNAGTLSPGFASGTQAYAVSVLNTVTSIHFTPTVSDATATVTINGATVASGAASTDIPLVVGQTTVTAIVTAQDGTHKQYVVTVTRVRSPNADLSNLASNAGGLTPAFAPGVTKYTINVANTTLSATITPTAADANATIEVLGQQLPSGTESASTNLGLGDNDIAVVVTAEDGTQKTYIVTINRALSGNSSLGGLTLSAGSLTPAFATGTADYNATVPYSDSRIRVTPSASDATATITVNGTTVNSGSASGFVDLSVGENTITVVVTAANGNVQTYTVTVTREVRPPSADATLTSLFLTQGELTPAFNRTTYDYAATVTSDVTKTSVVAIVSDANAKITVNGVNVTSGQSSGDILLVNGANLILVTVTAENGSVQRYTLTVTKANFAAALPNVFTPNGDGYNDTWVLPNINLYPDCTVKIFNRGGQQVFNSIGYGIPWDGTYRGKALEPGTYYYIIDLKHNQGIRSGSISIIK